MAYSVSNQPYMITPRTGGGGAALWFYSSVDAVTLVRVSGYFTDGYALGMRAGDVVFVLDNDASPLAVTACVVNSASATAVDLTNGQDIGGANSD